MCDGSIIILISVVGKIMIPPSAPYHTQRCLLPNPQNLWICYVIWKRDFLDVIVLRILSWEDYPGLSKWAQYNHKSIYKRKGEGSESERRRCCDDGNRGWSDVLWRWRKGSLAKERRWPLESGETRGQILPRAFKITTALLTLWF